MNYSDFRSLVSAMRHWQKQWFSTRNNNDLLEAKQLERAVDKYLANCDKRNLLEPPCKS